MSTDSCTTCEHSSINADCAVDAVIAKLPAAIDILNEYNIDTCCGGRSSIGEAAERAHVNPVVLVNLLAAASRDVLPAMAKASPAVKSCGCGGH